jgi:hypothetical protein
MSDLVDLICDYSYSFVHQIDIACLISIIVNNQLSHFEYLRLHRLFNLFFHLEGLITHPCDLGHQPFLNCLRLLSEEV